MPILRETIEFIKQAHSGVEYQPGMPYYKHPVRALTYLPPTIDDEVKHAILLHDVIEDTSITAEDLLARGYTPRTVRAVQMVSKKPDMGVYKESMGYLEWVKAIIDSGEIDAIQVKYADMRCNSDPDILAALPEDRREYFQKKYAMPLQLLKDALVEHGILKNEPNVKR